MAQFPHPHASVRAPRISLGEPEPVQFKMDDRNIVGTLRKISLTGGLAQMQSRIEPGAVAELLVETKLGPVKAVVQIVSHPSRAGAVQAFRFLALDDIYFNRLGTVLKILRPA